MKLLQCDMDNLLFTNICRQSLADDVYREWMTGARPHIHHHQNTATHMNHKWGRAGDGPQALTTDFMVVCLPDSYAEA